MLATFVVGGQGYRRASREKMYGKISLSVCHIFPSFFVEGGIWSWVFQKVYFSNKNGF